MNANRVTSDRGYLVIEPNIRGSTGYVIAFRDTATKDWGGLMKYMAATKEPALWYAAVGSASRISKHCGRSRKSTSASRRQGRAPLHAAAEPGSTAS